METGTTTGTATGTATATAMGTAGMGMATATGPADLRGSCAVNNWQVRQIAAKSVFWTPTSESTPLGRPPL
jgi:hypothetical protein